jgi:hypothetical protein
MDTTRLDTTAHRLQHVSAIDQQWGVWGAGPQNHPGNKGGWEQDPGPAYGIWITNTVGFAGPGQQYSLAIMYNLESYDENGDTGFKYGTNKLTQIAAILFRASRPPPHTRCPPPSPNCRSGRQLALPAALLVGGATITGFELGNQAGTPFPRQLQGNSQGALPHPTSRSHRTTRRSRSRPSDMRLEHRGQAEAWRIPMY